MLCRYCGKKAYVTHICPYCGEHYCPEYSDPRTHDCSSSRRLTALESEELPRAKKSALPAIGSRIAVPHSTKGILRLEFVFLLAIFMLSIILRMFWIKTVVVRDEGAVGYVAMAWLRGYLPYGGPMAAWNPPLAYLIYLLPIQIFGNEIIPIRMINNVLFWISVLVLYLIAKDWYGKRVGLVSALFYGVFMNAPIFEAHLAIPASLSLPFVIFSVYFCSIYLKKGQRGALLVSGLLMSSASLIVQYQVTGIFLLLAMLVYHHKASKGYTKTKTHLTKGLMTDILVLVVGVLLPFLLTFAYFCGHGVTANNLLQPFSLTRLEGYASLGDVYSSLKFLIIAEALPLWLFSVFGFIISSLRFKKYHLLLIAWTLLFLPIALVPPHFGRHFSQLIPPASLLAGVGIVSMLDLFPKNFRNLKKSAESIFFITVLVISFIPSIYFQPIQYPNTNFVLWNQTVNYSFSSNWNEQREIVDFITSNASTEAVFIHGWEAELYWLSGHLAPGIRWATSYGSGTPDFTDKDYQEILNQVKEGVFDYVILGGFPPDEIMRLVPERYFFVRAIGFYQIYSKYDAEGYSFEYSFVENFGQALQKYSLEDGTQGNLLYLNESIYIPAVEELTINNNSRVAIKHIPIAPWDSHIVDSNLIYRNISISAGSKLSFGIAMGPDSWTKDTDGVTFKILVQDDGGIHEIFSKHINHHENIEDRKWQDFLVDLNEFSGKSVSIYFVTNPGPARNNAYDWSYWSNPLVLKSRT